MYDTRFVVQFFFVYRPYLPIATNWPPICEDDKWAKKWNQLLDVGPKYANLFDSLAGHAGSGGSGLFPYTLRSWPSILLFLIFSGVEL